MAQALDPKKEKELYRKGKESFIRSVKDRIDQLQFRMERVQGDLKEEYRKQTPSR